MISEQGIRNALAKCSGYDPVHFPRFSQVIMAAWMEHFGQFELLTDDDVLQAVTVYYSRPQRPVPQPADISFYARQIWRDRGDFEAEYEALCDRKAGDPRREIEAPVNADPYVVAARQQAIERFVFRHNKTDDLYLRRLARAQRKALPPAPMPENDTDVTT